MTGIIFDIKEGAIHDGPGLRQTVFLKGCPLRCSWCHNPEGLSPLPELVVSPNGCTGCQSCMAVCTQRNTNIQGTRPAGCDVCGECIQACPQRIRRISGERISAAELACRLKHNADYYASTSGGVTFSGGEPLMQSEFVLETLEMLGPGIHTAVETSGYAPEPVFGRFMKAFDLVMIDLKSMDDGVHRHYTGVSNQIILQNVRMLCEGDTPFILRIPVIPGVNDNESHFTAAADIVAGAKALLRVEFLPYHKTAGAKYAMVGKRYNPGFETERAVQIDQGAFERRGIRSMVL